MSSSDISSEESFAPTALSVQEQESKLLRIFHLSTLGQAYLDMASLQYQFVNQVYANWFSFSAEDLQGKHLSKTHPTDALLEGFHERLKPVIQGEALNLQLYVKHPEMGMRRTYCSYIPDIDDEGNVTGIFLSILDITDTWQEGELTTFLQLAIDQGMDGFSLFDKSGNYVYVNPAEADIYGYEITELVGRHWSVLYSPDQLAYIKKECLPRMKKDGGWHGELLSRHKNGSAIHVEISLSLLKDRQGEVAGIACNCRNIDHKKQIEQELRGAAAVFESTAEGVIITDERFEITAVNPMYAHLTGFQEEQILGRQDFEFYALDFGEASIELILNTLEKTGKWQGEIYRNRSDGSNFPSWQTIAPVFDDEGQIKSYVIVLDDITQIKESQEKLYQMAHYDHLTGLPNRVLLNDRLQQAFRKTEQTGYQMALLFLDLDNFKNINDTHGHTFGDKLLCTVAQRLIHCCRDGDVIARVSGDEFIILVENLMHASMAGRFSEKLLETFSEPLVIDGQEYYQGVSIGISVYPQDGLSVDELMKNADIAMYKAKASGRQTYHFYEQALSEKPKRHVSLDTLLHKAIKESQFVLHYQPIIKADNLDIVGVEALIRWQHPESGLTFPDQFIPYAEGSRLIVKIGEWVLREACRQARVWLDEGIAFGCMSVNISGVQLSTDFTGLVKSILKESGLPPHKLELELTETYVMTEMLESISTLSELSKLGVSISIDDFGVGYSSLSRLRELPVQRVKIDRSFIKDIHAEGNDWAIVQAIIAMSSSLGLAVTAEGVETAQHLELLTEFPNLYLQGYYFSRPVTPEKIPQVFADIQQLGATESI